MDRRDFLKVTGAQAGALLAAPKLTSAAVPGVYEKAPDVVVVGAGAFGTWTALYLRKLGASVTLVDAYGPGNSRATSGDETRGVRSSYGNNETWVLWAKEAIKRWKQFDEEWSTPYRQHLFFTTGDLILRQQEDTMIRNSRATWDKHRFKYEVLKPEEIAYRYPQIRLENVGIGLVEPDAGVVRARRATQVISDVCESVGGKVTIARAALGKASGRRMGDVLLDNGAALRADAFVFACGPWLGKVLPDVMGSRMRIPMGHVFYYGTPSGDQRFTFPNCPSWNVPGVTGWPALGPDNRGFRVRTGGQQQDDPDTSTRWIDSKYHESARKVLTQWFPDMANAPLLETRACHYEFSSSGNFVVDTHPGYENVWIAGAGSAEGFKMGPVIGEYIAKRVLGKQTDPKLDAQFKIGEKTYEMTTRQELELLL